MIVREFAPAKVNLFLHVLGRRADGYHDLDSFVAFADVGDEIELAPDDSLRVSVEGPFAEDVPHDAGNLALRAAATLGEKLGRHEGVHVRIVKKLPVAAGLGGGSADAAAVLRGLAKLWETGPSMAFPEVAQALGADVPMCLLSRAARISGIGNAEPEALDAPLPLVLVNCGAAVQTGAVFARCASYGAEAPDRGEGSLVAWLAAQRNDLQAAAIGLAPGIAATLAALEAAPGCVFARMSGSGATCFGVFADSAAAGTAADILADRYPDWWIAATSAQ